MPRRSMSMLLVGGLVMLAATVAPGRARAATPSPDPDRAFLADATAIGRAMVETGKLAAQRGGAPEVRAIGHTVAEDWSAWLRDLERLASERVVTLPTALDLDRQATLERLQAATGEAFDAAYLAALEPLHDAAEELFETASHSADSGIQAFASHALPQLRADGRSNGKLALDLDEARQARPAGRSRQRVARNASATRNPRGGS